MVVNNQNRLQDYAEFEELFRHHAARVRKAWDEATDQFPELHKKPGIVRVSTEILNAQAAASEERNRRVLDELRDGLAKLLSSAFLAKSSAGSKVLESALGVLAANWKARRADFFAQRPVRPFFEPQSSESADEHVRRAETAAVLVARTAHEQAKADDDRRFALVELAQLAENSVWFLGGYAEAMAQFEQLIPYETPVERKARRDEFWKQLSGLNRRIDKLLDDLPLQAALPTDVLVALRTLHAYEPGLRALFEGLKAKTVKIDAAVRDRNEPGYLGARPRDCVNRIAYVAYLTFNECPEEALRLLTHGFESGDATWTREQLDDAVSIGLQRVATAISQHNAMVAARREFAARLWVFGQPQPLPRA